MEFGELFGGGRGGGRKSRRDAKDIFCENDQLWMRLEHRIKEGKKIVGLLSDEEMCTTTGLLASPEDKFLLRKNLETVKRHVKADERLLEHYKALIVLAKEDRETMMHKPIDMDSPFGQELVRFSMHLREVDKENARDVDATLPFVMRLMDAIGVKSFDKKVKRADGSNLNIHISIVKKEYVDDDRDYYANSGV